jgi:hypothetical protein
MIMHPQSRKRCVGGKQHHRQTGTVVTMRGRYPPSADVVMDAMAVLRIARQIEPNPQALLSWYQHVRITELDALTAEQLVHDGRAGDVVRFLRAVRSGVRH